MYHYLTGHTFKFDSTTSILFVKLSALQHFKWQNKNNAKWKIAIESK